MKNYVKSFKNFLNENYNAITEKFDASVINKNYNTASVKANIYADIFNKQIESFGINDVSFEILKEFDVATKLCVLVLKGVKDKEKNTPVKYSIALYCQLVQNVETAPLNASSFKAQPFNVEKNSISNDVRYTIRGISNKLDFVSVLTAIDEYMNKQQEKTGETYLDFYLGNSGNI